MQRNLFSLFVRYSSLNVMGMIGLSCYILADTFFIARGMGTNGLAALNLAIPVYSLIHGCGLMVGMGGGTKYTLCLGRGDEAEGCRIFRQSLVFAALLSGILFLVGAFGAGKLALRLGADEATYDMTATYLRMILLFAPAFLGNNVLLCFARNDGAPRLAMAAMLGGSFSNILLDYIFIFPLNMGMFGAVLATCMAPMISFAILSPHYRRSRTRLKPGKVKLSLPIMGEISALGAPSLITEVSAGVVMIVFNLVILGLTGNVGVAAYGVVANLSLVVTSIFTGLGQGIQPLVSDCVGRGQKKDAYRVYKYALASGTAAAGLVLAAVLLWAGPIAAMFNESGDQVLQAIAVRGLKLYFPAFFFVGFNVVTAVYFSAAGRSVPGFVISILRGFVLVLPLTFLLAGLWGMTGVWLTFPAAEGLTSVAALTWMLGHRKKKQERT